MNTAAVRDYTIPSIGKWSGRQLETMRRTIAPDATDSEFQQFLEYATAKQLDPFVGDVILVIYNKKNADKRKPTIITTQSGCVKLAKRCGNYRAASKPAEFIYDEKLKSPANPIGLVSCTVTLHTQDNKGDWYDVNGEAYWDEFAAAKDEWGEDESGKRRPTGKKSLEGNWQKMPRVMLKKCATMQALRAGWPETFGGVYDEDEMARSRVFDVDAVALIEHEQQERRQKQIAMDADEVAYSDEKGFLQYVPAGQFVDRMLERARQCKHPNDLAFLRKQNELGWNRFWAIRKDDALAMKQELETIAKSFQSQKEQKASA